MTSDVYGSGIVLRAPTTWDECEEINQKYYKLSLQKAAKKTSVSDQSDDDPLKLVQTYPEKEVQKYNITASLSQNGNVDIESDKFNPHLFLATKHHPIKYQEFNRAKKNLQTTMEDLNMKMILLSERNIHKFAEAKNIVDLLCSNKDAKFRDGSVERLDQALENSIQDAEKLFDPLIQRKEEKMHQFIKDLLQKCLNNYEKNTKDISELIEQEELFNHEDTNYSNTSFFRQLLEKKTVELVSDLTNVLLKTIPDFWQLSQNIIIGKYKKKKNKKKNLDSNLEIQISNLMKDLTVKYSDIVNTAIETIDNNTAHQKSLCQCICEIIKCNEQLEKLKIPKKFISNFGEYTNLMTRYIVNEIWNRTIMEISRFHKLENWKTISETLTITELPLKFQEFVIKTLSLLRPFMSKGSIHNSELVSEVEKYLLECIQVFADCFHELSFRQLSSNNNSIMNSANSNNSGKYRFSLYNFNKIEEKDSRLLLTLSNCSHTKNVIVFNILSAFVAGFKSHSNDQTTLQDGKNDLLDDDQNTFIDDDEDEYSDKSDNEESNNMKTVATGAQKAIAQMELSFHMTSKHLQNQTNDFMKTESVQHVYVVYDTLIDLLINDFVKRKSLTFYKRIEKGLLLSGYDWKSSPAPSSIRSYILDLLLELSMVHSKTEKMTSVTFNNVNLSTNGNAQNNNFTNQNLSVNRAFTSRIFSLLTERLGETFLHFSKTIEDVCENAAFQLDIDISFIRRALQSFETSRTKSIYQKINKHLTKLSNFSSSSEQYQILKNTLIASAAEKSFTQLDCFDIHVETSFNLLSISSSFRMMESGHTIE
ncbi:predicted protein [Naegleria gruberi]|uniref:Exocyst complex component n=1 Tax=Naegleria gruberi TaxID=5762 RepID=D2V8L9_NAEGR|nr:uncharacterized protein NAEGRDRAFT_47549 [Naegleria gruberi]EFC46828.1 predicted protein [Naegleria gruberi]|eukprot:XP_002679572.1 predicted protein [Naegleria gruberi strain NEG-M]